MTLARLFTRAFRTPAPAAGGGDPDPRVRAVEQLLGLVDVLVRLRGRRFTRRLLLQAAGALRQPGPRR